MARQGLINQTAGATMADDVVTALNNMNGILADFLKKFEEQQKTLEKRYKDVIDINQKNQTIFGEIKKQSKDLGIELGDEIGRARLDFKKQHRTIGETQKTLVEINRGLSEQEKSIQGYYTKRDKRYQEAKEKSKIREALEDTRYVATELWRSSLGSKIRDIIDNQIKQMNDMGKQYGLTRKDTQTLYQDVNKIRRELNINGGYLFSNEQVIEAMKALDKTNLSFSNKKAFAGPMAEAVALFNGGQGFEKIIEATSKIYGKVGITTKETSDSLRATLGMVANVHNKIGHEIDQGTLLRSLKSEKLDMFSQIANYARVDKKTALKSLTGFSIADEFIKTNLGDQASSLYQAFSGDLLKALSAEDLKEQQEYWKKISPILALSNPEFHKLSIDEAREKIIKDPTAIIKDIFIPLLKEIEKGNLSTGEYFSAFGINTDQMRAISQRYGGINKQKLDDQTLQLEKALGETEEENIKSLQTLNETMAEHQTIIEKLHAVLKNFVNDSGIGSFLTEFGIGRGTLTDVSSGISLISSGYGTYKNIYDRLTDKKKGYYTDYRDMFGQQVKVGKDKNGVDKFKYKYGGKGSKIAATVGVGVGVGQSIYGLLHYGEANTEAERKDAIGSMVGGAGVATGALIGTVLGGPIGTMVGMAAGEVAGKVFGEIFYKELEGFFDKVSYNFKGITISLSMFIDSIRYKIADIPLIGSGNKEELLSNIQKSQQELEELDILEKARKIRRAKSSKLAVEKEAIDKKERLAQARREIEEYEKSNAVSHRFGLSYVPEDDYLARLHRGEMVLTRSISDVMRNGLYKEVLEAATRQANGEESGITDVLLKYSKNVNKNKISSFLIDNIEKGMNTLEAKSLLAKNNIGTVLVISGHRSIEEQKALEKTGRAALNSAHLVGKAIDYNFISKNGEIYRAWKDGKPNPDYAQVYDDFGDIIENTSGGIVKNGGNFRKIDINHMQLAGAAKDAKAVREFLLKRKHEEDVDLMVRKEWERQVKQYQLDQELALEVQKINQKKEDELVYAALDEYYRRLEEYEKKKRRRATEEEKDKLYRFAEKDVLRDPYSYGLTSAHTLLR